jgi:protein-disulfide isomerase
MKKQYVVIFTGILIVLLFVLGVVIYKGLLARKIDFMARENASIFVREYSPTLGSDDAKIYLVKFSDPGCETCSAFHPFVKKLMADNPGKIKLIIRYATFHKGSDYMVKILEAARKQGKFWETLEVMYNTQNYWASHHNPKPQLIWRYLPETGLDLDRIRKDMNDPEIDKIIKQDLSDIRTLNVRKTPGFFVNGQPLERFGYKQLQELVELEIKKYY